MNVQIRKLSLSGCNIYANFHSIQDADLLFLQLKDTTLNMNS